MQKEQYQQAVDLAQKAYDDELPDRHGSGRDVRQLLVGDAVKRQNFDLALRILHEQLPRDMDSPLAIDDPDDIAILADMALVMKMQNPLNDEAKAILDHADALNNRPGNRSIPFGKYIRQASIESARSNKEAAVSALQQAFNAGWRINWRTILSHDFRFESLHNEPGYKHLIAMLEEDMQKQREQAYELFGLPH